MAYVEERVATTLDNPYRLAWGAIIAGWLVATGIAGLLYLGGLALGFSAFDAHEAGGNLKGIGIGSVIWMVVTWIVALFLGGMFASWFDGRADDTVGSMHGVTVWALSLTTTALWLALGFGQVLQSAPGMHGDTGPSMASAAQSTGAVGVLHGHVVRLIGPSDSEHRDEANAVVAALLVNTPAGDRMANNLLDADTSMSPGAASAALQRLSPQISAARAEAKDAANKASNRTAAVLWSGFISAFLALFAAALGGWFGARGVHRVYHLRRYEGRPVRPLP